MTPFASFLQAMSGDALDTLAGFDEHAALAAGVDPGRVRAWGQLHAVYLAPVHAHRVQARAVQLARRGAFSLDQLAVIERRLDALDAKAAERSRVREELLEALCAARPATYRAFERAVKEFVPVEPRAPRKGARFTRSKAGMRSMTVTADERDIADLEHALNLDVDPDKPAGPQMLDAFLRMMRGAGGGDAAGAGAAGAPYAAPRPLLLVPVPKLTAILHGEGDEVRLGLTDGTTITGAEFLQRFFANPEFGLEAALFHPQEGPVNLYRASRFANDKQRDLARATTPVCPVPDCRHSADYCQAHHITAWKHGGETNMVNLAMLCRYHNGTNDDDAHRHKRGRIEHVRGTPTWVSPRGYAVANTHHPYGAMHTLFDA